MKLTTWNVNGVRAREAEVADWLRLEQPDVLGLQEIKASLHQVPDRLFAPEGFWAHWHGEGGYSGVALLVSKRLSPVRPRFWSPPFDFECRALVASFDDVDVATFYVPNGGKDVAAKFRFLEALDRWVAERHAAGRALVLCGDFNVTRAPRDVHASLRNEAELGQTPAERALLQRLLDHGLTDLGRRFAPDDDALFTWWAPWRQQREKNVGWRLDLVLTSARPTAKAQRCTALREFGSSDHGPVTAVFEGPLFDPTRVDEGPAQQKPAPAKAKAPQLDLF